MFTEEMRETFKGDHRVVILKTGAIITQEDTGEQFLVGCDMRITPLKYDNITMRFSLGTKAYICPTYRNIEFILKEETKIPEDNVIIKDEE